MTRPLLPTLAGRPVGSRILRCIGLLGGLFLRDLDGRCRRRFRSYRSIFHNARSYLPDWPPLGHETPATLLRGCAADLHTALSRMERRFDVLPEEWTCDVGPCFERDPSVNLRPNRRSDAYMTDIENFHRAYPTATLFDVEVFGFGWEAGAEYGRDSSCTGDRGGRS